MLRTSQGTLKLNSRSAEAANHVNRDAGEEILVTRRGENLNFTEKLSKLMLRTSWGTLKLHFRSADAANHVNRDAGGEILVTRRAYIHEMHMLEE